MCIRDRFNIELFTGDPGDNNCNFFFGGAMDVLQKYIDDGKLVVKSGQTEFEQVATCLLYTSPGSWISSGDFPSISFTLLSRSSRIS